MAEQKPPAPTDGRLAFYRDTTFDKIARWVFWIAFGAITLGALVWLRFDGV